MKKVGKIAVSLPLDLLEELDIRSEQTGLSRSAVVSEAVRRLLDGGAAAPMRAWGVAEAQPWYGGETSPPAGLTWGELRRHLLTMPQPDDAFRHDLERIRDSQPPLHDPTRIDAHGA